MKQTNLPPARPSENDQEITGMRWVKCSERLPEEDGAFWCKFPKYKGESYFSKEHNEFGFFDDTSDELIISITQPIEWLDESPQKMITKQGAPIEIDIDGEFAEAERALLRLDPSGEDSDATRVYEILEVFRDSLKSRLEFQSQSPTGKFSIDSDWAWKTYLESRPELQSPTGKFTVAQYSPAVAIRLLEIRKALLHNDRDEAFHQLYMIASPNADKYSDEVWTEMEQISTESKKIID